MLRTLFVGLVGVFLTTNFSGADEGKRKLVLIAGKQSHPPLMHEFRAGCLLLEKCFKEAGLSDFAIEVHDNGWVKDESTFDDADAVVIYADGGGRHPALQGKNLETLRGLVEKGVGFGCMHYGVEVPPGVANQEFQAWLGGHYENSYSCNPIWEPKFDKLPEHAITRGVKPFEIKDEWYFNMRFAGGIAGNEATEVEGMKFVPILVAVPSDDVRDGPYVYPKGPYPHIEAASGRPEAMMWSVERPDGGRAFGFTGGHFHLNWGNDDFRKTVLNALVWVAKGEVPEGGVKSEVAEAELHENLDPKGKRKKAAVSPLTRLLWARGGRK